MVKNLFLKNVNVSVFVVFVILELVAVPAGACHNGPRSTSPVSYLCVCLYLGVFPVFLLVQFERNFCCSLCGRVLLL